MLLRTVLAIGVSAACACASRAATEAPNVVLAPEPGHGDGDRHERSFGEGSVVAYCDRDLAPAVEIVFDLIGQLVDQGATLQPGLRVHAGWTTLSLVRRGGELVVQEPDYDAAAPESATRPEITASLRMLVEQTEVLGRIGKPGQDIDFDQHVLLVKGVLELDQVYLVRVESPGGRMTGWRVAPTQDQETEMEVDSIPLYRLYKQRPALVRAMLLPVGYMAFFSGDEIDVIVGPDDQPVWERVQAV